MRFAATPLLQELGVVPDDISARVEVRLVPRSGSRFGASFFLIAPACRSGSGWTGGQYSVFRALFGSYLALHYAQLLP